MPAAAEPGAPPMNMRHSYMSRVSGCSDSVGMTQKPQVLGVTAW